MKERQRAHHVVMFGEQQCMPDPAVIDHPGIAVLRHLWHARGAAGMEIGRHAITAGIREIKARVLARYCLVEIQDIGMVPGRRFRPHQRHDPAFGRAEIAVEVNLKNRMYARRMAHRLGGFLGNIGLREGFERDHHLGSGFAQDRANLFGFKQRVDRVDDPGDGAADGGNRGFKTIRQDKRDNFVFTHLEAAKEVGRLTALIVELFPGQGM